VQIAINVEHIPSQVTVEDGAKAGDLLSMNEGLKDDPGITSYSYLLMHWFGIFLL